MNGFAIGGAVEKTRFYCLSSAKFHEKVAVRTGCAAKFNNFKTSAK